MNKVLTFFGFCVIFFAERRRVCLHKKLGRWATRSFFWTRQNLAQLVAHSRLLLGCTAITSWLFVSILIVARSFAFPIGSLTRLNAPSASSCLAFRFQPRLFRRGLFSLSGRFARFLFTFFNFIVMLFLERSLCCDPWENQKRCMTRKYHAFIVGLLPSTFNFTKKPDELFVTITEGVLTESSLPMVSIIRRWQEAGFGFASPSSPLK